MLTITDVTYLSRLSMTFNVTIPWSAPAGTWNLTVRNPDAKTYLATDIFTVRNPVPGDRFHQPGLESTWDSRVYPEYNREQLCPDQPDSLQGMSFKTNGLHLAHKIEHRDPGTDILRRDPRL